MIEAREVLCSEHHLSGDRLMTMWCRYPKFVHGEHLRHRSFSFSVSSSRAIPVAKNLEEVRSDELRATPVWWGREQKGMQSGEELDDLHKHWGWPEVLPETLRRLGFMLAVDMRRTLITDREYARRLWEISAELTADVAEEMSTRVQVHKSIVNRQIEKDLHVNVLVTGTTNGWMNFFGLRLDRAAQPEIRALAETQWKIWNESRPATLLSGEWHLPYLDAEYEEELSRANVSDDDRLDVSRKISTACCAHLSYESFETGKRMTVAHCSTLHDRLVGSSPIHASPAEHQATPDDWSDEPYQISPLRGWRKVGWERSDLAGNLGPGWIQYRKTLSGEAVAPLPTEYR